MQNRLLSTTIGMLNGNAAGPASIYNTWRRRKKISRFRKPEVPSIEVALYIPHVQCCPRTNAITTSLVPKLAELFASSLPSVATRNFFIGAIIFSERDKVKSYIRARIPYKFDKLDKCTEYWHDVDHTALVEILLDTCERMVKVSREIDSLKF